MVGFNNQFILLFLLLVPVLFYLYNKVLTKKKKAAIRFSNLSYIKSAMGSKKKTKRDSLLFYISIATITLMIIGFADPHIPLEQTKEGVNVVLVIDVSGSMQAEDYPPNRLESAKRSAETLLDSLQPKDNAGIVTFETGATTAAYLSPYKDKVIEKLQDILPRD
nr:VWA domain-containing protein [archaeon]